MIGSGREVFASDDVVRIRGSIDREYPVEVIEFMLQQFGRCSSQVPPLPSLSVAIYKGKGDGAVSADLDQQIGKAHAVVPERECFDTAPGDYRVDHGDRLGIQARRVDRDEAFGESELRRGYSPSEAMFGTERVQGMMQSPNPGDECRVVDILYQASLSAQCRIAEL